MRPAEDKILDYNQAAAWRQTLRAPGRKLVMTNGCFDLLHRGHVTYLSQARREGDALLVAINSDASLRELKGPTRPVVLQEDRAYLLASLECVDAVVIFKHRQPIDLFELLRPDIYVKGGDYTEDTIDQDERQVLNRLAIPIRFIPFIRGYSTSQMLARIRAAGG